MIVYRLRLKWRKQVRYENGVVVRDERNQYVWDTFEVDPNTTDEGHFFRRDKSPPGVMTFYTNEKSAKRALDQVNGSWREYEIVAYELMPR